MSKKPKQEEKTNITQNNEVVADKEQFYYTTDGYNVFADETIIAKSYCGNDNSRSVRILQGMDREKTIQKICKDCPSFAKENNIDENYYPFLFSD